MALTSCRVMRTEIMSRLPLISGTSPRCSSSSSAPSSTAKTGTRLMKAAAQDTPLMRALGLAHHWQRLMDEGRFASITEIAEAEGLDLGRASRIARLAQLAPSIVEACATGAAAGVTLESVSRRAIPQRWDEQRERLRLA